MAATGSDEQVPNGRVDRSGAARPLLLAFAAAVVSLLAVFIGAAAPIPLYNAYRAEDGFTNADISLTVVVYGLTVLAALLFTGRASNHVGRRATAIAALIALILACALLLGVHDVVVLLIARGLMGIGAGIASSNVTAYIVDATPPGRPWLAAIASSQLPMLGLALGAVLSGALVQYGPLPRQTVYLLVIALVVLGGILVAFSPETVQRVSGLRGSVRPHLRVPVRVRPLLPVTAAVLIPTWATGAFYQGFVPTIVEDQLHTASPLLLGIVFAAYMAPSALAAPLGDRFGPAGGQRLGMLTFVVGMLGVTVAVATGGLVLFVVATVFAGAGQGIAISSATRGMLMGSTIADRAPILSVIYTISYSSAVLPSLIAGQLTRVVALPVIVIGYGVLAVIATAYAVIAVRDPAAASDRPQPAESPSM